MNFKGKTQTKRHTHGIEALALCEWALKSVDYLTESLNDSGVPANRNIVCWHITLIVLCLSTEHSIECLFDTTTKGMDVYSNDPCVIVNAHRKACEDQSIKERSFYF